MQHWLRPASSLLSTTFAAFKSSRFVFVDNFSEERRPSRKKKRVENKVVGLGSGSAGVNKGNITLKMSTSATTCIVLFRNDLRVHDNEALYLAHQKYSQMIPLYCFDPRHYGGTYHFGFPKTGSHQLSFLLDSLADLRNNLQSHGSDLVVKMGKPEEVIPDLVQSLGLGSDSAIFLQKEVTDEEVKVEKGIQSKCSIPLVSVWGHSLYHIEDLPFSIKQLPDVYTQFRKKVENNVPIRECISIPEELKPLPAGVEVGTMPSFDDLGISVPEKDSRAAFLFPGGETSGLKRLHDYLWETDNVSTYKETRNEMIGSEYSTKFSPWLAHGCLSPRKIYWEVKNYERQRKSNQSTYWVVFELLWRDYFRLVGAKYGNKLFFSEGIKGEKVEWKTNKEHFKAWQEGKTGVPYVDANMQELKATGFMSNRGRQNVASFLTKDLQLDWRLGAEWFESLLIDHDVCSNYGNWQYSAGIGNDPREDRKFNMIKQGLDYDGNGDFVRLWLPELAGIKTGHVHYVWALNPQVLKAGEVALGQTYPLPIVIAPEWNRYMDKAGFSGSGARSQGSHMSSAKTKGQMQGSSRGRGQQRGGQKRGLDFYFSSPKTD